MTVWVRGLWLHAAAGVQACRMRVLRPQSAMPIWARRAPPLTRWLSSQTVRRRSFSSKSGSQSSSNNASAPARTPPSLPRLTPLSPRATGIPGGSPIFSSLVRGWPVVIRSRTANHAGVGLFATRDLPAEKVIFEEAPVADVPEALPFEMEAAEEGDAAPVRFPAYDVCSLCNTELTELPDASAAPCIPCPSPPLHPDDPPCVEHYCSPLCQEVAWHSFHGREHMGPEDVSRFEGGDMANMLEDEHKRTIVTLLLRVVAMIDSAVAAAPEVGGATTTGAAGTIAQLSMLDHLSHLSVLAPSRSSADGEIQSLCYFSGAELRLLEGAVGPMLQRAMEGSPALAERVQRAAGGAPLDDAGAFLVRHLLGALVSNTFRIGRAPPRVTIQQEDEEGTIAEHEQNAVVNEEEAEFTYHASLFSLAACINHACAPHSNVAIELDPDVPLSYPSAADERLTPLPASARMPVTRFAATRAIRAGEELLLPYVTDPSTLPVRYGFHCDCPKCTATGRAQGNS